MSQCVSSGGSSSSTSSPEDLPFPLPAVQRAPQAILRQRALLEHHMAGLGQAGEGELSGINREIRMKLSFLGRIQELRRAAGSCDKERRTLALGLGDRAGQLEEAARGLGHVGAAVTGLRLALRREEEEKAALQKIMEENRVSHHKSLTFIKAKVVECQRRAEELEARMEPQQMVPVAAGRPARGAPSSPPVSAAAGCVQFTNLFALSGQLAEFCRGEHGSRFVAERLRCGAPPERSLVRLELGLPGALTSHLASGPCRRVILALAGHDGAARQELLCQVREDFEAILAMEGGRAFVEEMVKG